MAGLVATFGSGAMTNSVREIGDADCILAIGSNTTTSHPIIGFEVVRAKKQGGRLIVANPRSIDLCQHADLIIRHKPGSDVALLMGMMRIILEQGLEDSAFIKEKCENFDAFKKSLEEFTPEFVQEKTGVDIDLIREAAVMYAEADASSLLYAMGITQHTHGTDNVMATANLAMLTGNVGKPSTGVNPLRGQNNVQGACDLGALPNVYTGYQKVADPEIQKKFESAWGVKLSDKPGITHTEIFDQILEGKIKVLYQVGENPVLSEANANHVKEAMEKIDLFIVQDIFLSESAEYADVVLPAASFAEKDGTFTNTERRVQRVRRAIPPRGESKSDWEIICEIAKKMGAQGFYFGSASDIMDEAASLTPIYGGISYDRIEKTGLQWPCPDKDHPGTVFLHKGNFSRGKGMFQPLSYRPPAEVPDKEYPLVLTTERSLFHFHTATMSRKVSGLNELRKEERVEIHPADAEKLGIKTGDRVTVTSRRGSVKAKAYVTNVSPEGVISMTFHFAETPTNELTNSALDPVSKIPETKVCAVKVEKVG